jgi:hypothetical protein
VRQGFAERRVAADAAGPDLANDVVERRH